MEIEEKVKDLIGEARSASDLLEDGKVIQCHRRLQSIRTKLLSLLSKEDTATPVGVSAENVVEKTS